MNVELKVMLARTKELLDEEAEPLIAYLQLHPDRVEDLRSTYGDGGPASTMARLAGIEVLSSVYMPKDRGCALDHNRKFLGVVLCDSTDPATWRVIRARATIPPACPPSWPSSPERSSS